jgi:hypothetical protein
VSIRDEAATLSKRPGTQQSKIARVIDQLDDDDRDDVVALIWDDLHISCRAAAEVLTRHYSDLAGGEITDQQVQDHRKKPRP